MTTLQWNPPTDVDSDEPGPHECTVGAFKCLAWDNGYWAIAFDEDGEWVVSCNERQDGLDAAKHTSLTRLRMVTLVTAEALGLLRVEVLGD